MCAHHFWTFEVLRLLSLRMFVVLFSSKNEFLFYFLFVLHIGTSDIYIDL